MAEDMGVDRIEAANKRISFLQKELKSLNKLYREATSIIDAVFINNQREPVREEIAFLEKNKEIKTSTKQITDEDIQRAREYPIDQIIEFNNLGKALAWCHEDKNPSLSHWKAGNIARCFTCNESFDSISAAMNLWNLNFTEAVRTLSQ